MDRSLVLWVGLLFGGPLNAQLPLEKISLPADFSIEIYAEELPNARSLALAPGGTLFVSTLKAGAVYAVVDVNKDFRADRTVVIADGLNMPNGIALRDGDLYVAEIHRVIRFDDIEKHLDGPPAPVVVYDQLPGDVHHGWKFIGFGPDDKLYVPVGAPCNICDAGDPYAAILRMDPNGRGVEVFARGVRNTVGLNWHPQTRELWFTDNGRDWLGDDLPPCELNRAPKSGLHFGYPYFHGKDIRDPELGEGRDLADYVPPARELGAHVAPLGFEFYSGTMFPATYRNQILIAEHGSWNRTKKNGYRLSLVRLDARGQASGYEVFAEGWLQGQRNWGRPVDLELMPDGSLLVSDDQNGVVYRIAYPRGTKQSDAGLTYAKL